MAKKLKREHERGVELGLREDELAFCDAICQNDSAVLEMGDKTLKKIARERARMRQPSAAYPPAMVNSPIAPSHDNQ